ncbi:MAG: DUF4926 domain-containing protein [Desulfobacterales bacterium]
MINEFETVVLNKEFPEYGLRRGDIGTAVHCYKGGKAFEVEFVSGKGGTIAVITL